MADMDNSTFSEQYQLVQDLLKYDNDTRNDEKLREEDFFPIEQISSSIKNVIDKLPRVLSGRSLSAKTYKTQICIESCSQDVIDTFYECYPFLEYIDMKGLFIAGGSVSRIILHHECGGDGTGDIDIFICGYNSIDKAEKRIQRFIGDLRKKKRILTLTRSEHAITLRLKNKLKNPVQLILRLYTTPSEVLHGFDLGSTMVGIWNNKVYTTKLGQFSIENHCNVLNLERRSTTYEYRLMKYANRCFDLVLPDLDLTKIYENVSITRNVKSININGLIVLILEEDDYGEKRDQVELVFQNMDYCTRKDVKISDYAPDGIKVVDKINFKTISTWNMNDPIPTLIRSVDCKGMKAKEVSNEAFNTSIDCLEDDLIDKGYKNCRINKGYHIYASRRDMFLPGVSLDEIYNRIVESKGFDDLLAVSKKKNEDKLKYIKENGNIPVKLIVSDPGTQLCGSFHPTVISKEVWYGPYLKL